MEALGVVWAVKHFRHYLYGNRCNVYTDHEALRALLNTPHPSGKLARWGLTLQELDFHIHYRPGPKNTNADALSRYLIRRSEDVDMDVGEVAALFTDEATAKSGDPSIAARQEADATLRPIRSFLQDGTLPPEKEGARKLLLEQHQYALLDDILYRVLPDSTLRLIPPSQGRYPLFQEAHGGTYGGHLRSHKVHSQLSRSYWWPRMRQDIVTWC